ncbi:MAG: hypothetical protein LIP01_02985 [Tannerellaceae bacterium]|nr:hypothetical protein [Tannerellaceae bacterium]
MGEISEGLINGEFDYITGEYIGEGCGYPRTSYREKPVRRHTEFEKARQSLRAMAKSRNIDLAELSLFMISFLEGKGYKPVPVFSERYVTIFAKHKNEFRKYLEASKRKEN